METLSFLFTSSFYPPYHVGGDANHVKYLAEELVNRGHEVHVLYSLDAYSTRRYAHPQSRNHFAEPSCINGVITHPVETRFSSSAYAAYLTGYSSHIERRFSALVKEINPDVVHHNNIAFLGYGILEKRGSYLNLYTAHDYWLICARVDLMRTGSRICERGPCILCPLWRRRPPQLWRYTNAFKKALQAIDILVTPSDYVRKRMSMNLRIKSVTLPNFVPKPPRRIRRSGFSDFFLFAGHLERHKGVLELIELFNRIHGETNANLVIIGEGSLKEKLCAFYEANQLEGRVSVLGWVDDDLRYRLLRDANALIVPSMWPETSSLIAMESLSVGTPAIASNQGALPEVVGKLDNKLIYNSISELRQILLAFDKRAYPRKTTKAVYERYFSPPSYLHKYLALVNHETKVG